MDIQAVIFDCDGTLVNSEHAHYLAWQKVFQEQNFSLTLEEYMKHCVGVPDLVCCKMFAEQMAHDNPGQLLEDKVQHFVRIQRGGFPPIQDTIDFLHKLAKEKDALGLRLAVASAARKKEILLNLKNLGITSYFDVILSGQDDLGDYVDPDGVNKPKPYIYLHAAKMLGVAPDRCIAVEDSPTGVAAAVDAGCITIAIPNSFTADKDLSRASKTIDSLRGMSVELFLQLG